LNQNLYTASQIKLAERCWSDVNHRPTFDLMEMAASELDQHIEKYWPDINSVCICCGSGNNGGDGLLLASKLIQRDISVRVLLSKKPKNNTDAFIAYEISKKLPLNLEDYTSLDANPISNGLIIDAILGSGFVGDLKPEYSQLFERINISDIPILSVDAPSGVNVDSGRLGLDNQYIKADHTLTFGGLKPGLLTGRAKEAVGKLYLAPIDLLPCLHQQIPTAYLYSQPGINVSHRSMAAHKGSMGNVLLIGGDRDMGGAIILAIRASAAMGVGYVRCISHPINRTAILSNAPESLVSDWPDVDKHLNIQGKDSKPDALVLGPGLGLSLESKKVFTDAVSYIRQNKIPTVMDADALTLLAKEPEFCDHWILTPHPKEAARLLGDCLVKDIEADRQWAIRNIQQRFGGICILKGAGSLIYGDATCTINDTGNPGMARAGMGDVLSGILGGLIARNSSASLYENACLGVWIHGQAGDQACIDKHQETMQARDLVNALDHVWPLVRFT